MKPSKVLLITSLLILMPTVYSCQQPCILLSNTTNILAVSASGHLTPNQHPTSIVSKLKRSVAIDVHVHKKLIFWSELIDKSIKRASIDGSNITTIVQNKAGTIEDIAVEWNTNLLYWTEKGVSHTIKVARLDGSMKKVFIEDNLVDPRGIAVDPQASLMFWTNGGVSPKIESAYLNGENRRTVVTFDFGRPHDITLDFSSQKMYWTDDGIDKIAYANYNGDNCGYLHRIQGVHHFAVDIYSFWLYSTSFGAQLTLNQINKTSGSLMGKTQVQGRGLGQLVVLDSSRQPSFLPVQIPCKRNNGGCSDLCLLKPNGYSCQCSDGMILGSDGKTCRKRVYNCGTFIPKPDTVPLTACKTNIGSRCSFSCRNGYPLLNGSAEVTCLSSGNWSSDGPTCVDLQPPFFTSCPANIVQYAGKDKTSIVTWSTPQATDNSDKMPSILLSHGPGPSAKLPEDVYHINYTASDEAKNKAVCSFTVTIKVIRCTIPSTTGNLLKQSCENHYGGSCTYSCPSGYNLVGSNTLNCLASHGGPPGYWDNPMPKCQADTSSSSSSGSSSSSCFPGSAKLTLSTGDFIKMEDLRIGDTIQTLDPKSNEIAYSEVLTFLHKDSNREMFLDIKGEDDTRLVVSHKHLVYSGKTSESMRMKFADEVKTGDFILANGTGIRVTTVKTVNDSGVYAPMTRDGTMQVNGVYVSCYANFGSQEMSHLVMSPIRLWFDLSKVVRNAANFVGLTQSTERAALGDEMSKGLHVYADALMTIVHYLPRGISDLYNL